MRNLKDDNEKKLNIWIRTQRENYNKEILSKKRINLLEKQNWWSWDKNFDIQWNKTLNEIINFYNKYSKQPSSTSVNKEEKKLGVWIVAQRKYYNNNMGRLTKERIKKLNAITWWVWKNDFDTKWINKYNEVLKFNIKFNRLPSHHVDNSYENSLGMWISNQKTKYKNNKLTDIQINKLEIIKGWFWKKDRDLEWNIILKELIEFYKKENRYPKEFMNESETKLYHWIGTQRYHYNKNTLDINRIYSLEKISWWQWEIGYDTKWKKNFKDFIEFYNKNYRYPSKNSNNNREKQLNTWFSDQRTDYRLNKLTKERIEILEKLEWWTWKLDRDEQWNTTLNELIQYYNSNKKYPSSEAKDKNVKSLGVWRLRQINKYKKQELSKERIDILQKLDWWKW